MQTCGIVIGILYLFTGRDSMHTLVFDVYGTLVDAQAVVAMLEGSLGERAELFARQWRAKMLEYSYRMGLMRWYKPFSECIRFAFLHTCETYGVTFSSEETTALVGKYRTLPPYEEAHDALDAFCQTNATCFAFSNGAQEDLESLLQFAGLRNYFHDVVSVESIRIYKPSRIAYAYVLERIARYHQTLATAGDGSAAHASRAEELRMSERRCLHYVESGLFDAAEAVPERGPVLPVPDLTRVWLISSNPFDVIGAKVAGLQAVWIRRSPKEIFDPWGVEPTITVANLTELYDLLKYKRIIVPISKT